MKRNFGFIVPESTYSHQEFKQACSFNLFIGTCMGIAFSLLTGLVILYALGLVW